MILLKVGGYPWFWQMANLRFIDNIISDASNVERTGSSETYGNTVENLVDTHLYKVWQTEDILDTEYVIFDLQIAKALTCLEVLGHNFNSGYSDIKFQGNASDSWGSPSFSHVCTFRETLLTEFFATQSYRYWRLVFTKSASSVHAEIGRIIFGTYYECPQNFKAGTLVIGPEDLSITVRSPYGPSWSEIRSSLSRITLDFDCISTSQVERFLSISSLFGGHTPLVISIDHDSKPSDWLFYGKIVKFSGQHHAFTSYWSSSFELLTEP